ncbi:MAG: PKD domain-containing protein [Brumimicrobium sp.]|nr:PKD domain-containing protein [Brumimicrobium sp.]
MKNLLHYLIISVIFLTVNFDLKACHALAVTNYNLNVTGTGVQVNASSTSPTCGCGDFWLDVEIRCMGEPFDAGPFDPTQYLSLATYPYFQSATMLKPNCVVQAYPTVTIPFTNLCPGIQYQVRVRENNNGNGGPWSNALTFTAPGTITPLTGQVTASNVNLCVGDCTTLTASVTGGCGLAPLYSWNTGATTPSINVCPTVTTTYTVTITEQCSNLSVQESITVYVVPTPIAGTAAANPTSVCAGQTTNLTLTGYDGNIQWQSAPNSGGPWTNVAGLITDNETSPPINNAICFRAVVSGCGPAAISNVVCVTVAPPPVLTVSNSTICNGQTTSLTSTVDLTGGTYSWNPSGQTGANLTNVSPNTTTTYDLTYSLNGCTVTASGTVTVNPQPTTLALVGSTICEGASATITATPDVAGGTYQWTPNVSNTNTATVTPPVGTNTYTIDYDVNGCTYSESVDIIVNPGPTVDVVQQEICNGETATLTATPDIPGGTFSWNPGGQTTATINVTPANTTNYTVTYTLNGCIATDNADVIVNPMPVASFTTGNVCEDQLTPLNSTSNVPAPGIIQTTEWDIGNDGSVEYLAVSGNHDFGGYGTYDINMTVTTAAGCTDNITQTVQVYPLPIVDFTATPLCLGSPTDFTDQTVVPNGGTINNWNWNFDDGNTANTQNPQHTYANPGIYNVDLEITTAYGCVANLTQPIEIYGLPVADFIFTNDCFYNAIDFTNTSTGNASIFEWDFDDGSGLNNLENPSHNFSVAGNYNVTLTVSTSDGCTDNVTQTVTAYAQPDASFTVAPVCYENNSQYQDQSTIIPVNGDIITGWNWSFGDGNTSNNQNPTHQYASENVYSVNLTVTTNYGCTDSYTDDAIVWPLPEVDFSPTSVCLEANTQFQDQSSVSNQYTPNNNVNWLWDFGDGGSSNQQNPSYAYQNDGVFNATLTVTSNNGCVNQATLPVTVHPKPAASFTGINLTGCSPVCFDITSTSVVGGSSNIVDYQWNLSNGYSYNSSTPDFENCFDNNSGNDVFIGVELIVTTEKGCQDTHFEASYIEVYHNPIANFHYEPGQVDIMDPSVDLINTSQYANNYDWYISGWGSSTDFAPVLEFNPVPESYDVELIVSTNMGCTDTAYSVINVLDRLIFYVPNTFTPDFDDFNQTFKPIFTSGFDPMNYNLTIYNRWGEVIFESNDSEVGWDGTYGAESTEIVKDGTYLWRIEFKETDKDKRIIETGHVNVLR